MIVVDTSAAIELLLGLPLAHGAQQQMLDLNVRYFDHAPLRERIWQLRENLTAYDASYVALAEVLGVPLLTSDARIVRAPGHGARCILVE